MKYVVGVDIGGTFTDCVVLDDEGAVTVGKALSTPDDFSQGALDAVRDAAQNLGLQGADELLLATKLFFHACTVADNTLITRSGPKTGSHHYPGLRRHAAFDARADDRRSHRGGSISRVDAKQTRTADSTAFDRRAERAR